MHLKSLMCYGGGNVLGIKRKLTDMSLKPPVLLSSLSTRDWEACLLVQFGYILNEENELSVCIETAASLGKLLTQGQVAFIAFIVIEMQPQLSLELETGFCGGSEITGSESQRHGL